MWWRLFLQWRYYLIVDSTFTHSNKSYLFVGDDSAVQPEWYRTCQSGVRCTKLETIFGERFNTTLQNRSADVIL